MILDDSVLLEKPYSLKVLGGPGSGNFGHRGRPGEIGGSTSLSGIVQAVQAADGGFTYHAVTGTEPKTGYALSLHKDREQVLPVEDVHVKQVAEYVKKNRALLQQPDKYLGGWHNPNDGQVYLDVSTIVTTAAEAEQLGRTHGQLAYFDLAHGRSVDIALPRGLDGQEETNLTHRRTPSGRANLGRYHPHHEGHHRSRSNARRDRGSQESPRLLARYFPLHTIADAHAVQLSVALRYAFARGRKALGPHISVEKASAAIEAALSEVLPEMLLGALVAGGTIAVKQLSNKTRFAADKNDVTTIKMRFDANNPKAVAWAEEHAAELVTNISEVTRERLAAAIAKQQETGEDAYDEILAAVGDEDRATLIARHESMVAAGEGQRQAWDQAVDKGLLTGDEKRVWIVTDDERLCPICEELDGETAILGGEYPGGYEGPPAHVQCRCTEGIL